MRVLIVEDEPRMMELLRQGLYERGFTVMSAGDGVTGLEVATAFEFDAIVRRPSNTKELVLQSEVGREAAV